MKTIEELKAQHAKEIKALEAKTRIAEYFDNRGLPIPEYIGGKLFGAIGVTYRKMGKLSNAIELMERFPVIAPFQVLENGFTILAVEDGLSESDKERGYKRDLLRLNSDYACSVSVSHIEDSPSPTSARLQFFTRLNSVLFNVDIEFGTGYIGGSPKLAPGVTEKRVNNRVIERNFKPNIPLNCRSDGILPFASGDVGPLKKSANHVHLFVSDHGKDPCSIDDCSHAVTQLRSLAEEIGE